MMGYLDHCTSKCRLVVPNHKQWVIHPHRYGGRHTMAQEPHYPERPQECSYRCFLLCLILQVTSFPLMVLLTMCRTHRYRMQSYINHFCCCRHSRIVLTAVATLYSHSSCMSLTQNKSITSSASVDPRILASAGKCMFRFQVI
jgi:hypothetical protein